MSANRSVEMMEYAADTQTAATATRRRLIRYVAAALSGLTAGMYFLIGFHVVTVLDANVDQTWALLPAAAYAFGAALLVMFDHRVFWIPGAVLQVFVIFTYFNLASRRTPAYEFWGVLIRIAQLALFIALAYLSVRPPVAKASASGSSSYKEELP